MVYLPIHIYHKNQPNVGEFFIHGSYGEDQKLWKTCGGKKTRLHPDQKNMATASRFLSMPGTVPIFCFSATCI